jgi:hypothetical protein
MQRYNLVQELKMQQYNLVQTPGSNARVVQQYNLVQTHGDATMQSGSNARPALPAAAAMAALNSVRMEQLVHMQRGSVCVHESCAGTMTTS